MSIEEHKRLVTDFVNHHPGVGAGRDATINSFRDVAPPGFTFTVRRMIAEGDQVWNHGVVRPAPGAPPAVVVDIWRIENGLLAEHWDVGQSVPDGTDVDDML